ncbi:hypothetical protein A3D77_02740 [Candidatus Gottesmanbacteria bacterium RIFCSPHIGHO2_02_FULL_39_11]|uniref:Type 4 fimbrial biogenesis protein PilX N-terminal domain-containing protein n=1 Tax=Candidatus Gottesmanbacteria bacterium RIFCSPHIGHO2_02_FULL_39_11 TaxID=1798382 RepID=A0A1F5ZSZ2_9BACT|nr:MAG: hypothetical protein A3D77_02740 [Candidatus Gottesmanbacteria bacterium RIFCSPHIGHO2_02_FULL_39_11]
MIMHNLRQGQTIFEVLVGLTLIMLFLTGIVTIELIALKNTNYAKNKSLATTYASEQLERIRVARDTIGLSNLYELYCSGPNGCYIDDNLTPFPNKSPATTPYVQQVLFSVSADCPTPPSIPNSESYKVTATSSWAGTATDITPAPEVSVSSCMSDWR